MRRMQRLARRGKLLGLAPLGQGQGGGVAAPDRFIGPPYYLINDTFTTDRAAGAVNGTDAEPGPGRRTVTDTNLVATITGGALGYGADAATNAPRLLYSRLDRVPGRILTAHFRSSATTTRLQRVGFANTSLVSIGIAINSTTAAHYQAGASGGRTLFSVSGGVDYYLWVILRATGHLSLAKGGEFMYPTLLWIGAVGDNTPQIPAIESGGGTQAVSFNYLRVPATRWLPTPLISDGFSAWGTSDGLGHAEGIAGGLGSGGGGLAMTAYVGTWGASGGVASCSILTSGVGLAGRDVGTADMIATVKITRSGGVAGLFVRENADDRVMAVHNGTNAQLIRRVGGVETTLVNVAAAYVAGAELRLICEGTKFRLYYNNTFVGSEQTISDVSLQAETLVGLYTNNVANTFDDFVVYARGTGGEYAALDAF